MSKKQTAPSGQRASRMGTGPPADGDTERAKAMGKKNPRQAHAESDAPAERAEGQDGKNDLVAVVGVGASAGGLEAFRQLLKRLPVDTGMAIVLITHLDPRHESILPDLVAKATPLPVSEAEEGMRVTPNHVYVMPRNTSMAIEGGALRLWPREKGRSQHRPIDAFLRTLAEDQNTSAIGIILSGTATDGTLGLEAVKAEGGITFAQEPKSAQYDSMPRSAIAAGCVDFVLTPEEIALELTRISRHPYVVPAEIAERGEPGAEEAEQPAVKNGFNKILAQLRRMKGIDFTLYKANTLRRRIRRRMILNKLDGLMEYAEYLRNNPAEVENLYQDILINVTSFFRDPDTFEALKEKIFPRIVEHRPPDEPVRIWVVGSSTGEEAYSIAMAFSEFAGEHAKHILVQIFATDLNERSIERARAGLYSKNIAEDVSPERLRRFFTEAEGGYRISKPIRDMCVFARQNIITDPPFSRMDLISCRNLLIYLEPVLQKQVLPLLHYALNPTGVLWLGHSETTGAASGLFEPEDKKHRFYVRKLDTGRPRLGYPTVVHASELERDIVRRLATAHVGVTVTGGEAVAQREADRIVLARYAPASALIDEEMKVLQLRGDTSPYLDQQPNKATRNLLKLAREGLLGALREAVDKARQDESPVRKENLRVKFDEAPGDVNLEVIPLRRSASQQRHYLILFETAEVADRGGEQMAVDRRRKSEERKVRQLSQELAAARDYLQSVIEEYEATNEELQSASEEAQSSNEELQSINEELETSKEELESSNEELITLNEELNNRNAELGRLNSDLVNLLGSVQSSDDAMVAIDLDGVITSWNQGAEHLFGYTAQEAVGQPVTMLTPPEGIEAEKNILERMWAGERINHFETLRRRKDGSEVGISLTMSPIRNVRGEVIGASRIARDVTERKRVEEAIRVAYEQELAARAESEQASRLKDEFLATVSHELRSPLNSILGWSRMLSAKRLDEEESTRALEVIYKSARAQNQLIGELLDVSRIITGKLRLDVSMVDLIPIIEAAMDIVRPAAEAKKIGIISSLDPAAGPVSGDADRLQQVVWNLLSNAIKFTPAGGEVAVRLEREDESVTITVSDNGEGIEPEFLPFVFDRFRQFEGGTARPSGGLGLGLAIVRHLVELHGGTVSAASRGRGQGATFRATLPLAVNRKESSEAERDRPAGAGEIPKSHAPSPDLLRDLRVLLVDDEPDARELLSLMLMSYEAEVRTCASAPEALQTLDEWRPDVLVSDIGMPVEDGYELIRKIRAREPERGGLILAVALTAYARDEDARRAIEAGYQAHVPKPVEPGVLATAVANLAGRR